MKIIALTACLVTLVVLGHDILTERDRTVDAVPYVKKHAGFTLMVQADDQEASGPFRCHWAYTWTKVVDGNNGWVCDPVATP